MRVDMRKLGAAQAQAMTDLAIHLFTASPEELEREERDWEAAHPLEVATRERFRANQEMWRQRRDPTSRRNVSPG